jgi:hypothetical protein
VEVGNDELVMVAPSLDAFLIVDCGLHPENSAEMR